MKCGESIPKKVLTLTVRIDHLFVREISALSKVTSELNVQILSVRQEKMTEEFDIVINFVNKHKIKILEFGAVYYYEEVGFQLLKQVSQETEVSNFCVYTNDHPEVKDRPQTSNSLRPPLI
jgi:hypothetical protein